MLGSASGTLCLGTIGKTQIPEAPATNQRLLNAGLALTCCLLRRLQSYFVPGLRIMWCCLTGGVMAAVLLVTSPSQLLAVSQNCSGNESSEDVSGWLTLPPTQVAELMAIRSAISRGELLKARELLQIIPSDGQRRLWEGVLLLHERRTFASIRKLEELAQTEESGPIETLLAVNYLVLNQRQLTQQAVDRALKLDPDDPRSHYLRGRLRFVLHDFAGAITDFSSVLTKKTNDFHSLYYRGFSEWLLGNVAAAQTDLTRSVDVLSCQHIHFPFALQALAQLELETGQISAALNHTNLGLNTGGRIRGRGPRPEEIADILLLRGKVHIALGHQGEAENDWHRAIRFNPNLETGWYLLARLYQQRGETKLAAEALMQFQKIHDDL